MGSDNRKATDDVKNQHSVTLSDFYICKYEVTQEEWQAVMGRNPSAHNFVDVTSYPVDNVSWDDCQEFISKLNALTGMTFRLPTEAEWEYAARGGNKSKGYDYAGSAKIDDVAWYWSKSAAIKSAVSGNAYSHPVGGKQPNELGLYDMSGNAYEWCADWWERMACARKPILKVLPKAHGVASVVAVGIAKRAIVMFGRVDMSIRTDV